MMEECFFCIYMLSSNKKRNLFAEVCICSVLRNVRCHFEGVLTCWDLTIQDDCFWPSPCCFFFFKSNDTTPLRDTTGMQTSTLSVPSFHCSSMGRELKLLERGDVDDRVLGKPTDDWDSCASAYHTDATEAVWSYFYLLFSKDNHLVANWRNK